MSTIKRHFETFELLRPVIEGISKTLTATGYVTNVDGSFTLTCTNTLWLHASQTRTITIGANTYKVTSVTVNESFTIICQEDPVVAPSTLTFDIWSFNFIHGTVAAAGKEYTIKDFEDKCPFVWLPEPEHESNSNDPMAAIGRTSDLSLYCMSNSNKENWMTEDHYNNIIRAMRNLAFLIEDTIKTSGLVNPNIMERNDVYNHANWGTYSRQTSGGLQSYDAKVFDETLSGCQIKLRLPFFKGCCNC